MNFSVGLACQPPGFFGCGDIYTGRGFLIHMRALLEPCVPPPFLERTSTPAGSTPPVKLGPTARRYWGRKKGLKKSRALLNFACGTKSSQGALKVGLGVRSPLKYRFLIPKDTTPFGEHVGCCALGICSCLLNGKAEGPFGRQQAARVPSAGGVLYPDVLWSALSRDSNRRRHGARVARECLLLT